MSGLREKFSGFSLVEGVAACAILFTLVGVGFPAYQAAMRMQENTVCVSNLRQIGTGILYYANDREGWLPGPITSGQRPYVDSLQWFARGTQLAWLLDEYLYAGERVDGKARANVFLCPAARREVAPLGSDASKMVHYGANVHVLTDSEGRVRQPFGYAHSIEYRRTGTRRDVQPMRLMELQTSLGADGRPLAATTFALRDADRQDDRFRDQPAPEGSGTIPQPAHGKHRNTLFFDFRIEPQPVTNP